MDQLAEFIKIILAGYLTVVTTLAGTVIEIGSIALRRWRVLYAKVQPLIDAHNENVGSELQSVR